MEVAAIAFAACVSSAMVCILVAAIAAFVWWRTNQRADPGDDDGSFEDAADAAGCPEDAEYVTREADGSGGSGGWKCPDGMLDTGISWAPSDTHFASSSAEVNAKQCAPSQECVTAVKNYAADFPYKSDLGGTLRTRAPCYGRECGIKRDPTRRGPRIPSNPLGRGDAPQPPPKPDAPPPKWCVGRVGRVDYLC